MFEDLREEITRVAYDLYERGGRIKGNDLLHWLEAEKIVFFNRMIFPGTSAEAVALLEYKPLEIGVRSGPSLQVRSGGSRKKSKPAVRPGL